ncbi:TPA: hypothetical protein ACH3X1_012786 [Trebouxia sp. C0004]
MSAPGMTALADGPLHPEDLPWAGDPWRLLAADSTPSNPLANLWDQAFGNGKADGQGWPTAEGKPMGKGRIDRQSKGKQQSLARLAQPILMLCMGKACPTDCFLIKCVSHLPLHLLSQRCQAALRIHLVASRQL